MKKGIALLITIGFVAVLTALIAYIFSLSNSVFNEAEKVHNLNQGQILSSDIKKLVDRHIQDVNSSDDFSNFLIGIPPFYESKSGLGIEIELAPLSNRININSILVKNKINKNIEEYLQKICDDYNVLDSSFFIALVLDTIDTDVISRQALSEISMQNIRYSNGKIFDKAQFEVLKKYYAGVVQDKNIFAIPWKKFIYFGDTKPGIVDCDRMSKEMIDMLGLQSENYIGCDDLKSVEYKDIASKYNLKKFNKVDHYYILVRIYYQVNLIKDRASFVYDIKTKKASSFELF